MSPRFRRLLQVLKGIAPFFAAFLVVYFKANLAWLGDDAVREVGGALAVVGIIQLALTVLFNVFKAKIFASAIRYVYVAFFLFFVYSTGGINSSFIFTLLLPVVTPAVH